MPTQLDMDIQPTRAGTRRDFWIYWTGQTISQLGSSFTMFALPLLVYQLTQSPLNLGVATAATFVPYLLFGLLIGAWVDRVNRKRLMILTDLGRALAVAAIPLLEQLHLLNVAWVYGLAFLSSTLTIFFTSSEFAAIPSLVDNDDLIRANGRIQASYSGASILGPLLAGLLLAVFPLTTVFLVDAGSFLVSAVSIVLIRVSFNRADAPQERKHILRDVAEGLRFVLGHPVLRSISLMMALVNLTSNAATAQVVLFAKQRLSATNSQVALLYTASSAGVVVFALLAGPLRRRLSFGVVALGALAIGGLVLETFAYQTMFWVALPLWGMTGIGVLLDINTLSLRQAITPNHLLGRVISIAGVLAWSAIPLGAILGGVAVQQTGDVTLVFALAGALNFVIPVAFFLFSPLGRAERYVAQAQAAGTTAPAAQAVAASEPGA
jgi:MFS family permease